MKSILTVLSVVILFALTSCEETTKKSTSAVESNFDMSGVIQEAIQTSDYTYCLVKDGSSEHWIAFSKAPMEVGQTIYFNQGLEMIDFNSKALDRVFPSVFFIQEVSTDPNATSSKGNSMMQLTQQSQKPQKPQIVKSDIVVEKADGGISIAELFANKEKYEGKRIIVRGKVTKYNDNIMDRNWIHIQDGTDSNGDFDLTITLMETVNVGAVATFEGTITLNKDFGAGYKYDLIMEEAVVVIN